MCTVKRYIRAPVTSATLHDWNQNSRRFKSCSSHPMSMNTLFQTRFNVSGTDDHTAARNDVSEKRGVFLIVPKEHSPSIRPLIPFAPHSSHNCRNNSFLVPLTFSVNTAHICTWWMNLTMTNFYRRSSNCQPHHTVHLSVVSTTVLTITTAHSTASSTTVLLAHHFLCPAIVRARLSLSLPYITINY